MVKPSQGVWAATQSSVFALFCCFLWTGHAGPVGGSQSWSDNKSNTLKLWFVSFFPLWSSRHCHREFVLHRCITKGPKDDAASLENQTWSNKSWSNSNSNDTNGKKRLFSGLRRIKQMVLCSLRLLHCWKLLFSQIKADVRFFKHRFSKLD